MKFIFRRLGFYVLAFWIAITINFALPRLMPGDPASTLFASYAGRMTPEELTALRRALGFTNQNILQQYVTYLGNLLHGQMGLSYSHYPVPVMDVIRNDIGWTLLLVGIAVTISFTIGTLLGTLAAWKRGSLLDSILPPVLLFCWSFPPFFLGMLLLYFLGLKAGWFPISHAYAIDQPISLTPRFVGSVAYHAILPATVLVITTIGGWCLGMRNNMVATLSEDYITMAEAKGLRNWRVMLMYAARNAILPQVTAFAITLGFVVSGQVLIESIFSYPGVGFDLVTAATNQDYPLLQGLLLFIVAAVLLANFLVDILYVRLDPRARVEA
ncbi:MAG TPA: ABC transporter permease [Chloroflexota bacterium]|nr:ABC transporter permease [Chloroflexota bacterium]